MESKTPKKRTRRILPEKRKKISTACDSCKKRKFKCTGEHPCALCIKKGVDCKYTIVDKRSLKGERMARLKQLKETQNLEDGITNLSEPDMIVEPEDSSVTINKAYIPKSLQPLLSFPLENEKLVNLTPNPTTSTITKAKNGITNQNGKCSILVHDSSGNLRYVGETSSISLLYECRIIFSQAIGPSKFIEDLRKCVIADKPVCAKGGLSIQLPKRQDCIILINYFKENINDVFFVFDMNSFNNSVVNGIYDNPSDLDNRKLILLYLVFALGSLFQSYSKGIMDVKSSLVYFENALSLMRDTIEGGNLWLVQAYFLIYFYYQASFKKSTSWIHLNIAIKHAQALGLHRSFINEQFSEQKEEVNYKRRLFGSLYVCDRISSILLGRPLGINDYDWDDNSLEPQMNDFQSKCQVELCKLCQIIGKIVANFYRDGVIDINRTKNLAIELKLWSINLNPELQIDKIIAWTDNPSNVSKENNYILLLVHILQLYGIMLLSRPFLMYEMACKLNPELKNTLKNKILSMHFSQAAVKASILTIKLINYYLKNNKERTESYVTVNCCFYASLIIGIRLIHGGFENDEHSFNDLMDILKIAVHILTAYSPCNVLAERFVQIIKNMIEAVTIDANNTNSEKSLYSHQQLQLFNNFDMAYASDLNFINDVNDNLQTLIEFQQFFVPQETAPTTSNALSSLNNNFDRTVLPYDYGLYELFFGDKY